MRNIINDPWIRIHLSFSACLGDNIGQISTVEESLSVEVAIIRCDRLYLVTDSANASAISQLALTRVTDVSIFPVFDAIHSMGAFR